MTKYYLNCCQQTQFIHIVEPNQAVELQTCTHLPPHMHDLSHSFDACLYKLIQAFKFFSLYLICEIFFCFLCLTTLRMLWPFFVSHIYCQELKPRPCKRSCSHSVAVTLPAAMGVIGPNWEYKSRALNETFHKSAPVLQAVQQRIQINTLGGRKCCDLFVMSELVRLTSIACGLSRCLGFRLSLGMLKSDAQVRFVLEFSVFFHFFFLVCSKGSKGSGGQVYRGVFLSRSTFSWWYCIDCVIPLHPTACNFSQIRQISSLPVVFELRD